MNFTPKDMGDAADASRGSSTLGDKLKDLGSILLILGLIYIGLGFVSDIAAINVPNSWEAKLARFHSEESSLAGHPREKELTKIFEQIKQSDGVRELPYDLVLVSMEAPNAFAMPGGTIGVTDGLLENVESEKSLALVLAHEFGHHAHRHTLKRMGRGILLAFVGALFGTGATGDFTLGTFSAAQLGFSRAQETEADEFAVDIVKRLYGDLDGAYEFFEDVMENHEQDRSKWKSFLSTHPYTPDRLQHMKERAARENGT